MNWKEMLHRRSVKAGLCLILIFAIVMGLCYPGAVPKVSHKENPLTDTEAKEIQVVQLGENTMKQNANGDSKDDDSEFDSTQSESVETKQPLETDPKYTDEKITDTGHGQEGQEDGNQGEEGGEEAQFDLAMVMTWYRYGTEPKTIVCGPSETVGKSLNTAQLADNELKYGFSLVGENSGDAKIKRVYLEAGNEEKKEVAENGKTDIYLPDANRGRDYTFYVEAHLKTKDGKGTPVEHDITFTYVLHCRYALDLDMELEWKKANGQAGIITCMANDMAARTIQSNQLTENSFQYTPRLIGSLSEDAKILKAEYTTGSGGAGTLNPEGGSLILKTPDGAEEERYYFVFEAETKDKDGNPQTVTYRYNILFVNTADVKLSFTWLEKGVTKRTMVCQANQSVSTDIKKNQLSAGSVKYEMSLTGADSEGARILNISYVSEAAGGGKLDVSGAIPMELPEGYFYNTYTITAIVLAQGKQMHFDVELKFAMDVSLEMSYSVRENGKSQNRVVLCENGKTKTADVIYDDQLSDGILSYEMKIAGSDAADMDFTAITCYQSGNGRIQALDPEGDIELLLKEGKTGENTFTITAEDRSGMTYEFKISIPYKHRGENTIKIMTNLLDGQVVINETKTNLNVRAWSEDESGNVMTNIPANGTETKLIVMLDGETLSYVSTSGAASEYILYPKNPVTGDTNTHTVYVYAEDPYGNYGELTVNIKGQRNQAGQKVGTATIYVDLSVLGLGVIDSVKYDVLADEPISYSVAKAVMGLDTGEPFGKAEESLGYKGRYSGTFEKGFYLQGLTTGHKAIGLKESSWNKYGSNEKDVLEAIDAHFGKGTGLATLWRCIYRNGLNKSTGVDGTFEEFDFTSGSGWLFSLDGTYYPGLSMSDYSLEDGDVLTLRYTLAYGWDVGSGTPGYGNTTGYCVTAMNGSFSIEHQMETRKNEDGSSYYICKCCGLMEGCAHEHKVIKDQGDGTHIEYCEDCKKNIGDPKDHVWEHVDEKHVCADCKLAEEHRWKEVVGSNTATCISSGTRKVSCTICKMEKEEESPPTGHSLNNRWNHTETEHYQKCSVCEKIVEESKGTHQYVYDANDDDWYCKSCNAGHDWDYCGNDALVVDSATCKRIDYHCEDCGLKFYKEGNFEDYHSYADGKCKHCGKNDPNVSVPPENPDSPEEPSTETETQNLQEDQTDDNRPEPEQ